MTLAEIKTLDRPFLWADEVAPIIRWDPQWIRICGRQGTLPFPTTCHGRRVQIHRVPFIKFMEEGGQAQ